MISINFLSEVSIGKTLDNSVFDLVIDIRPWRDKYPELTEYRIEAISPSGIVYLPKIIVSDDFIIWHITNSDTAEVGTTTYQVVATGANGGRKTSYSGRLNIGSIIDGTDSTDPPEPSKPWVDAVLDAADRAEEAAKRAESAGGGSVTPEQISQAVEDYLTKNPVEFTEEDPTVPAWAKQPNKPTYTAEEVGAQPKGDYALKIEIPSVPVQSVNGKTGNVQLNAADLGAASTEDVERLSEEIVDLSGAMVKSVNGTKPDKNGDVQVQGAVSEGVFEKTPLLEVVLEEAVSNFEHLFAERYDAILIVVELGKLTQDGLYYYLGAGDTYLKISCACKTYAAGNNKIVRAMFYKKNGIWMVQGLSGESSSSSDAAGQSSPQTVRFATDFKNLGFVRVYGGASLAKGAKIRVYGMEAAK